MMREDNETDDDPVMTPQLIILKRSEFLSSAGIDKLGFFLLSIFGLSMGPPERVFLCNVHK